jgi:TRAP-type C4-dicarboxylate transport system substrate-binding protein
MTARAIALTAAALAALAAAAPPVSAVEWKYSSWTPPNAPNNRFASIPFMEAVTKETGGALTFKNFMGAQLFNNVTTLQGIRDGAVDAGVTVPVYNAAELKHHTLLADMQAFHRDPWSAAGASNETLLLNCPECLAEYDKSNSRSLGVYGSAPYYMLCAFDVKTMADLKGTKMGGGSAMNARWGQALGQTRLQIGPGDMLQSLSNRQVDCMVGPKEWLHGYSLKDVIKTVVDNQGFGIFPAVSFMTVNKGSWARLTDDQRKAMVRNMPIFIEKTVRGYVEEEARGEQEGKAKGAKFVSLGQPLVDAWNEFLKVERAAVIDGAQKRGVANPDDLVRRHEKDIAKWHGIVDKLGKEEGAFARALWEHVHSKVKL